MARKTEEARIEHAARSRGWGVAMFRHTGNPDYIIVTLNNPQTNEPRTHMHTLENVLRWIRRQGRANG